MSEREPSHGDKTVQVIRGQYHRFMLIPIMDHQAEFIPAGPVAFGIEGRAFADALGRVAERGVSVHVFNADRSEEYARYDCFEGTPHYHYILNGPGHNVVWGYDPVINGPMLAWALGCIRERLPAILRGADAHELAERIEREGWDTSVLAAVEAAALAQHERTCDAVGLAAEGLAWMKRWKALHPEFNTADY
jgi:hypothetical protein